MAPAGSSPTPWVRPLWLTYTAAFLAFSALYVLLFVSSGQIAGLPADAGKAG